MPKHEPEVEASGQRAPKPQPAKKKVTGSRPPKSAMRKKEKEAPPSYRQKAGQQVEWAGDHHGPNNPAAIPALKRANMLKALIEPKTEAMVQVLEDLALGYEKQPDGSRKELNVHASIRMEAASRLLDRVYGKPKEHLILEDAEGSDVDQDEVMLLLNNILKSVGAPLLDTKQAKEGHVQGPSA